MFYKPGSFLINPLSLTNTFYLEWKTNSHLVFLIQKKIWKELAWHRYLRLSSLATFQAFFAFAHSSISAHSWRLKDNTSFSESKKLFVIYSLSIYFSSTQHRGESKVYQWCRLVKTRNNLSLRIVFLLLHTFFFFWGGGGLASFFRAHLEGYAFFQFSLEGVKTFCCAFWWIQVISFSSHTVFHNHINCCSHVVRYLIYISLLLVQANFPCKILSQQTSINQKSRQQTLTGRLLSALRSSFRLLLWNVI